MDRTLAVILAGGSGDRLSILSAHRAKPALPFGGKFRLIDFPLSNCVNSGITNVLLLVQYQARSLTTHVGSGQPWDLDRLRGGGLKVLQPYLSRTGGGWYQGTADAVRYNLDDIRREPASLDLVLILAGDHVYKMDYRPLIAAHRASGAEATVAVRTVPTEEASRMGICELDPEGFVIDWEEKPASPKSDLASMGVYVFNRDALHRWLGSSRHDFGHDVIPAMLEGGARVFGHRFDGYWRDVGTIEAYWSANLDLVSLVPPFDLFDTDWLIHTRSEERSPAKMGPEAVARHALISHGCIINGSVYNSVLAPGVRVMEGAVVRDSILLLDVEIAPGAQVSQAIVDVHAHIGAGAVVGGGGDVSANVNEPDNLYAGISIVGESAIVPSGARLGHNVRVDPGVTSSDFLALEIPAGHTVRVRESVSPSDEAGEPLDRLGSADHGERDRPPAPAM